MSNRTERSLSLVALAFALATAAVPLAHAQSAAPPAEEKARPTSFVTFYGHVFGHTLDAPMPSNTQFPVGEDNYGLSSTDVCGPFSGALDAGGFYDCDTDPANKLAFYSTAGFVQVASRSDFANNGGYEQLHNERGSTKDIVLDTAQSVRASFYVSQDFHNWYVGTGGETYCLYPNPRDTSCLYPYWGWDPGVQPAFVAKASLYYAVLGEYGSAASEVPPIREAYESGQATLVAEGATQPAQVMSGLPGSPNVNRFDIDLGAPKVAIIPKEANFFLIFSVYNDNGGTKFAWNSYKFWSGEFFPPSYTLPVKNAFDVESVIPQSVHGKLAILGIINTPWGSYDVDPEATRLVVTKENGEEVVPVRIEALADYSVAHGAHYKPVNVTYVWDYKGDKLAPGKYVVTISAKNHQNTAGAACAARFTIEPSGETGALEAGFCGQQTAAELAAQTGDPGAPAASGGSRAAPPLSVLPVLGLAGVVLARRRWP